MPTVGEPSVGNLAQLGHRRVVDRLLQLLDDHALLDELTILVAESLAMASVQGAASSGKV